MFYRTIALVLVALRKAGKEAELYNDQSMAQQATYQRARVMRALMANPHAPLR
jgi:hypothetical protein